MILEIAVLMQRQRAAEIDEHDVEMAAREIVVGRRHAAIGHRYELDAGADLQKLHGEMHAGAGARGARN